MNLAEVEQSLFHSLNSNSSKFGTSSLRIINLLNKTKKEKAEAVETAFWEFMRGNDSVIILSVTTSSKLFQFILKHVPKLFFVEKRVVDDNGKRKDVIALLFTHEPTSI